MADVNVTVQKTSAYSGDGINALEDYRVTVEGDGSFYDFDIVGPNDLLTQSYDTIFQKIAKDDEDVYEVLILASIDEGVMTFNDVELTPDELEVALEGIIEDFAAHP